MCPGNEDGAAPCLSQPRSVWIFLTIFQLEIIILPLLYEILVHFKAKDLRSSGHSRQDAVGLLYQPSRRLKVESMHTFRKVHACWLYVHMHIKHIDYRQYV